MSPGIWAHKNSASHTPLFDRFGGIVILCMQGTLLAQLLIPGSIFASAIADDLTIHGNLVIELGLEVAGL